MCPFLRSRDGSWSSAYASRELRCWAVSPAALPAIAKQRQVCQVAAHAACATYEAAMAQDPLLRERSDELGLWPEAGLVPVTFESTHARPTMSVASPRAGGQALLVGLMVVAFLVLVIARTNPLTGGEASPSPVASAQASSVVASAEPSASVPPSIEPSPTAPTPTATPEPTPTEAPSASPRTYKVRSGDTIASIAAKFNTTVKAIVTANNIKDPRTIHAGQVLVIP